MVLLSSACTHPRLGEFEATLAAQDSATVALTQWCEKNHLAVPARITSAPVPGMAKLPAKSSPFAQGTALGYRHVRLSCGSKVLSEAHNWYDPARLTPAMNEALSSTNTPFGKVVAPLQFRRIPLLQHSQRGRGAGCPAGTILTNRARLELPNGQPLALVIECYTTANMK